MIYIFGYLVAALAFCLLVARLSRSRGPELLIGLYVACVVVATVIAAKLFTIGTVVLSATVMTYSLTFLFTDMLSEFYGKKAAHNAIITAVLADVLLVGTIYAALRWTPASFWEGQDAMEAALGQTPRIVLASVSAYVLAQLTDVTIFHRIKDLHGKRLLWVRNNVSTLSGQTVDSIVFYTIGFLGVAPLLPLIGWTLLAKVVIAIVDTPVMYLARRIYYGKGESEARYSQKPESTG